jgi:pyruvate,water dikinase
LPEASFAGQQDTYLNVIGRSALEDAVKRCWGSLWTARAMAYRLRQNIAPADVALAVVVQEMAPATAAGVLFTVNPVTGAANEMVINATWGLGEALVSGRVNPDTIIADKATGRVKSVVVGDKAVMTALEAQGVREIPVNPADAARQAVDAGQVLQLVDYGRRLEALFQKPQDVEWAIAGGQVVLLQSRPVTTQHMDTAPGDDHWPPAARFAPNAFDLWTQYDLGERWPDPVTPLTWSVWEEITQRSLDKMMAGVKAPYTGRIQWSKRAFGHVYFNEGALIHAYTDGVGTPVGMVASGMTNINSYGPADGDWQWGKVLRHIGFLSKSFTVYPQLVAEMEALFPQIDAWVARFLAADRSAMNDAELMAELWQTWMPRVYELIDYHSASTSLATANYGQMEALVEKVTGEKALVQDLVGGLSGIIQAEIAPMLWEMAQTVRRLELEAILLEQPAGDALAVLRQNPVAAPLMQQLAHFLQRHGGRTMTEAEFFHPRWAEEPAPVIESIASYLRVGTDFDPFTKSDEPARRREAAMARVLSSLPFWRKSSFRKQLATLQRYVWMRDNGQHYVVKLAMPTRILFAELGRRWFQRGWLSAADEIFFLVHEEIDQVVARQDPLANGYGLAVKAAERRTAWRYWFTQAMPDVLDATGAIVAFTAPSAVDEDGQVLTGLAASRGSVTGVARVVTTPQEAAALKKGEILVTRSTDPGWTPVFSIIGGAVLEIGGMLSHGAIVAREYGLPAVVNIPQAMQLIQDGQRVTVDGTRGRVVVHG